MIRSIATSVLFVASAALALGAPGLKWKDPPATLPIRVPVLPTLPAVPAAPKADQGLDKRLDQLEQLRREKGVLEERVRVLLGQIRDHLRRQHEQIRDHLRRQNERLNQLGRARAAALVHRLGSPKFAYREAAQKVLTDLGAAAAAAVRAGTKDSDAEVARRCEAILPIVRAAEQKALVDGTIDWPAPAGTRFRELVGDSKEARKVFALMTEDDRRAVLVDEAAAESRQATKLYAVEIQRLQQAGQAVCAKYSGLLAEQDVWVNYQSECRRAVPPGDLIMALFMGALADLPPDADPSEVKHVLRATFIDLAGGPTKDPCRTLFAAWLDRRRSREAMQAGLEAALYAAVAEAAPTARRAADDPDAPAALRAAALTVLGHYGRMKDLPLLSRWRDNDRPVDGVPASEPDYAVRVRDVAAVMSLRLRGQSPVLFGYSTGRWVGHWFGPDRPPFETVRVFQASGERAGAEARAWDWLDKQPNAPRKPERE